MKLRISLPVCLILCLVFSAQTAFSQKLPTEPAEELINQYLQEKQADLSRSNKFQYKVSDELTNKTTNIRYIYVQQQYQGIDIEDAMLILAYSANGAHTSTDALVYPKINTSSSSISAEQAVRAAMMDTGDFPTVAQLGLTEQRSNSEQYTIFDKGDVAASEIITRLIYVKDNPKATKYTLAWETQLYTLDRQHYWAVYTDAITGKVLKKRDLVLHCSFGEGLVYDNSPEEQALMEEHRRQHAIEHAKEVETYLEAHRQVSIPVAERTFMNATLMTERTYRVVPVPADSPIDGTVANGLFDSRGIESDYTPLTQSDVTTAGDPIASPYGWTSTDGITENPYTKGNNVWAFYDPSPGPLGGVPSQANSAPESPVGSGNYIYTWDLDDEPNVANGASPTTQNTNSAITTLFYMNNMVHDVFYHFGFTEENRNFQSDNMGKGGLGNDEVLAQAQDGGGTNNANMLTLRDGVNGQMQMYLWTPAVEDDIVFINANATTGDADFVAGINFTGKPASFPSATNNQDLSEMDNWKMGEIVLVNDPDEGCTNDPNSEGCGQGNGVGVAACNSSSIDGKIAILRRGNCSFVEKVHGAQESGAIACIVVNNVDGPVVGMGGSDVTSYTIQIPSCMISKADGEKLITAIANATSPVTGTMKLENPLARMRDGDYDNGVIAHEYGHGISTRTSPQTAIGGSLSGDEQGGEGWSDYWGLYMTLTSNDLIPLAELSPADQLLYPKGKLPTRGIGNYVTYQPFDGPGIRPQPYSVDMTVNDATYNTISLDNIAAPHGVGFVWCTMLYELTQELINRYGFNDDLFVAPRDLDDITNLNAGGNNIANILILEGIRNQPASPTFTAQRDAIITADELMFDGAHKCDIWAAFARRGCGFSAESGSNAKNDQVEAYDLPFECDDSGTGLLRVVSNLGDITLNSNQATYTVSISSVFGNDVTGVVLEEQLPDGFSFVNAKINDVIIGGATANNIPVGLVTGASSVDVEITVSVNTATETDASFYDVIDNENHWETTDNTSPASAPSDRWAVNGTDAFSGGMSWYVVDPGNFSDQILDLKSGRVNDIPAGAELVFFHSYATEASFDGGKVYISTNGGASFTDLGSRMTEQGYNDDLPAGNQPNPGFPEGGPMFGGGSGGYVRTHVDLADFEGQDAIFRFRFAADVGTGAGGWAVDNFLVGTNPTFRETCSTVTGVNANGNTDCHTTLVVESAGLAVELLDLTATPQDNSILLNWTTLTEDKNAGFAIERRAENEVDFKEIGFVKGEGTTQQSSLYTYDDADVKNNTEYYYRLRIEELGGGFKHSDVVSARIIKNQQEYDVELVPNPTSSELSINWTKDLPGAYELQVTTINGQVVYDQSVAEGTDQLFLNLDLPPNVYLVRIYMADNVITKKLVIK